MYLNLCPRGRLYRFRLLYNRFLMCCFAICRFSRGPNSKLSIPCNLSTCICQTMSICGLHKNFCKFSVLLILVPYSLLVLASFLALATSQVLVLETLLVPVP